MARLAMLAACAAGLVACGGGETSTPPAAPTVLKPVLVASSAADKTVYTVKILDSTGGPDVWVEAFNNHGQVVGGRLSSDYGDVQATVWDGRKATEWVNFGPLGSLVWAINDAGQMAGMAFLRNSQRAMIWRGATSTELGTLGGSTGIAYGINQGGQVVGYSHTASDEAHATLWRGKEVIDLGTLGGTLSIAFGINDAGDAVGYSSTPTNDVVYATLWKNGAVINLGALDGYQSRARAVNNKGQVVGWSFDALNTHSRAVLWENGTVKELGTLGGRYSSAHAINNAGCIVGASENAAFDWRGTMWCGPRITDLNAALAADAAGITIGTAIGINNSGEILAAGWTPLGERYMLLTPNQRQ